MMHARIHASCVRVGNSVCPGGYAYVCKTLGNVVMCVKKNLAVALFLFGMSGESYGRVVLQEHSVPRVPKGRVPLPPVVGIDDVEEELDCQERYQKVMRLLRAGLDYDAVHELWQCDQNDFRVIFLLGLLYHYKSIAHGMHCIRFECWKFGQACFDRAFHCLQIRIKPYLPAYTSLEGGLGGRRRGQRHELYDLICRQSRASAVWKRIVRTVAADDPILACDISLYTQYMDGVSSKSIVLEILKIETARVVIVKDEVIE
jgi:hypothetical protein